MPEKEENIFRKDIQRIKELNRVLSEKSLAREAIYLKAMPIDMNVETTVNCNLQCLMCQLQPDDRHNWHPAMNPDLFRRIARDYFAYLQTLSLTVIGEPLLSDNLFEILDSLKNYGVKLELITNGILLNNDGLILKLLDVLKVIKVSIDAAYKDTYESIRRGGDFDRIIKNLQRFNELRQNKINKPILSLLFVAMKRNIEELPDFIKLAKRLGAEEVGISHLIVFRKEMEQESLKYHQDIADKYFIMAMEEASKSNIHLLHIPKLYHPTPIVPAVKITVSKIKNMLFANETLRLPQITNKPKCRYLWEKVFISTSGDVLPCCGHVDRPIMGNILKTPLEEIWNNSIYLKLRQSFITGELFEFCKNCSEIRTA